MPNPPNYLLSCRSLIMSKSSKDRVIKAIKDAQALEIAMTEVDRNENASLKRQKVAAFSRVIDEYLK
jgi:hypothetical protein